jgi:glutathione S-transferase
MSISYIISPPFPGTVVALFPPAVLQAMAANKRALLEAVAPLENLLSDKSFLAGTNLSLADLVTMADLRAAFEKVRISDLDQFT